MNISKNRAVVAIGNFDGVHKGHAALLRQARDLAVREGLDLTVLTFEPHPRQFFNPDTAPFRLTPQALKAARLHALGVTHIEVLDFNAAMAAMSAQDFINDVLVATCNAAHVFVGADFHFGAKRTGNVETLRADGRFGVPSIALEVLGDAPISSTRIRDALMAADIASANAMLGWDWEICGEVMHGDKRGRELGYPTANIAMDDFLCPAYGIYAVRVDIGDGAWRMGAASIGLRPMFALKAPMLEVFLLDFTGDLYGRTLHVRLVAKLRDEMKFEGLPALQAQMAADVADTRLILTR